MSMRWDREVIYFSGDEYFNNLLTAIDSATHSILLESYIFDQGTIGDRVVARLIAAAQRGVDIKLLIDGIGSPNFAHTYLDALKKNKIGVKFFRALPWIIERLPGEARQWYLRIVHRLLHLNKGNHRKILLIDERLLLVGSFNISDVHSESLAKDSAWKDIGAEVEGVEVKFVRQAFYRAYKRFHLPQWRRKTPQLVLLNDAFIIKHRFKLQKLERLKNATHRILLQTPYFVPPGYILRTLVRKAKRGITVQIIVPEVNDVWIVRWMSLGIIHFLSRKGVQIFFYKPRFNHQKVFIIDDWTCLGSTNLNHRSFLHDLEIDIVITHNQNKKVLEQAFAQDLEFSERYDPNSWPLLPPLSRWIGNFLRMLRYWA